VLRVLPSQRLVLNPCSRGDCRKAASTAWSCEALSLKNEIREHCSVLIR
jgi:hypothetical protein